MTKLDLVLERIRKLPPEQQEAVVTEVGLMLDEVESGGQLSAAQEQEIARRLGDQNRRYMSHEDVQEFFEKKYGR